VPGTVGNTVKNSGFNGIRQDILGQAKKKKPCFLRALRT